MENQHRLIAGYRELDAGEIALINDIKATGRSLAHLFADAEGAGADPRWLAIAKTNIQQGMMALTRSIAKPEGF